MDPAISFCRTPDGAQIAYTTLGGGTLLIVTPSNFDAMDMRFKVGDERFWNALASHFTIASYDRRGTGLSDRDRSDFSPAADAREILAVADAIGAPQFDLLASFQLCPAAVHLAIDQPQRLRRLALTAPSCAANRSPRQRPASPSRRYHCCSGASRWLPVAWGWEIGSRAGLVDAPPVLEKKKVARGRPAVSPAGALPLSSGEARCARRNAVARGYALPHAAP